MFNKLDDRQRSNISVETEIEIWGINPDKENHQLTINASEGTVELFAIARLGTEFEPLLLEGEAYVHDLATGIKTIKLTDMSIKAIKGVPHDLGGEIWGMGISSK